MYFFLMLLVSSPVVFQWFLLPLSDKLNDDTIIIHNKLILINCWKQDYQMKNPSIVPLYWYSSVQPLSHVQLFATPWTAPCQASLSITNSWSLLKLMSIESVMHLTISSSVVSFSSYLQSFPASAFFSNESVLCIRWPKYWSSRFSISPSNEYSGLISFRID